MLPVRATDRRARAEHQDRQPQRLGPRNHEVRREELGPRPRRREPQPLPGHQPGERRRQRPAAQRHGSRLRGPLVEGHRVRVAQPAHHQRHGRGQEPGPEREEEQRYEDQRGGRQQQPGPGGEARDLGTGRPGAAVNGPAGSRRRAAGRAGRRPAPWKTGEATPSASTSASSTGTGSPGSAMAAATRQLSPWQTTSTFRAGYRSATADSRAGPWSRLRWPPRACSPTQGRTLPELTELLRDCWRRLPAPRWPRVRDLLEADIAVRSRELAEAGLRPTLTGLHPAVGWEARGTLRVQAAHRAGRRLGGHGLLLLPSAFVRPALTVVTDPPWQPTLIHPARGVGELWRGGGPAVPHALACLLGRTRAPGRPRRARHHLAPGPRPRPQPCHRLRPPHRVARERPGHPAPGRPGRRVRADAARPRPAARRRGAGNGRAPAPVNGTGAGAGLGG